MVEDPVKYATDKISEIVQDISGHVINIETDVKDALHETAASISGIETDVKDALHETAVKEAVHESSENKDTNII
jgi:hypothetical protein